MENIKTTIEPEVMSKEDISKSAKSVQDALGIDDARKMEIKVIVDGFSKEDRKAGFVLLKIAESNELTNIEKVFAAYVISKIINGGIGSILRDKVQDLERKRDMMRL